MPVDVKIDFNRVSLHGRSSEVTVLNSALQTLKEGEQASVVTINGSSGTGKSYLVESWLSELDESMLILSAKFNQSSQSSAPYSAVSQVILQLVRAIPDKEHIANAVRNEIGEEIELLTGTLPSLLAEFGTMIENPSLADDRSSAENRFNDVSFQRFLFIFREFFRCVCNLIPSYFVIFFDDMQYADENAKQILRRIVGDQELKRFLLILSAHDTQQQLEFVDHLRNHAEQSRKHFQSIDIGNLNLEAVNAIISELTLTKKEQTLPLAIIAVERTGGNPFFTLQFLHILQQRGLLRFSTKTFKFVWDLEAVRHQTQLADNLAEAVRERVAALDSDNRKLLTVAAYLGASFHLGDVVCVMHIMNGLQTTVSLVDAVNRATLAMSSMEVGQSHDPLVINQFEKVVNEKLLDPLKAGEYKFTHDSIQHFFLSDGKAADYSEKSFRLQVGTAILALSRFFSATKGDLMFAAAKALNDGIDSVYDNRSKIFLATLNLEVAEIAVERSAFFASAALLESGMSLLMATDEPWLRHNALMNHMCCTTMYATLACGQNKRCRGLAEQLLENGNTLQERMDARFAIALSLRAENRRKECLVVLLDALALLGEKLPNRPNCFHVLSNKYRARKLLRRAPIDSISSLVIMKDEQVKLKMKFLNMVLITAYRLSDYAYMRLVAFRMLILSLRHGLCKYSPFAFAATAWTLVADKKYEYAYSFGELSNSLINKLNAKENLPIATFYLSAFVNHLHQPMHHGLRNLKRGFRVGMESGHVEMALLCASTDVAYQFTLAYPLEAVLEESRRYFFLCGEYNQDIMAGEFLLMAQLSANLCGESEDPFEFDGKFMRAEQIMTDLKRNSFGGQYCNYLQMLNNTYMGDWEKALEGTEALSRGMSDSSHYSYLMTNVYSGIIYLKAHDRTGKSKYKRKGIVAMRFIEKWVSRGALNLPPCLWLMQAHMAGAKDGGFQGVKILFDKAINGLRRCGFRHLEALACENMAQYAMQKRKEEDASYYFEKSFGLYMEWGAVAKAKQMKRQHARFLNDIDLRLCKSNRRRSFELESKFKRSTWFSDISCEFSGDDDALLTTRSATATAL